MNVSKCRGCGAAIVWIRTIRGKAMPCNAEAVEYQKDKRGKDFIVTKSGDVVRGRIITDGEKHGLLEPIIDGEGYISHYATCPKADLFRKKR